MDSTSAENNQNNQNTIQKKRGGSQKRSWVWEWFVTDDGVAATCQVEVVTGEKCGKKYQHKGSTGILIEHLSSRHQITKETTKENYVVRNKIK
jgi:hypothetical protein